MTDPRTSRPYEVVLLGATGFTGSLVAEHLARAAPADLRWALAGRDRSRLTTLADRLSRLAPERARPDILLADTTDPGSLRDLAASSAVLATTVGPFLEHGAGVVAACAATGTDYADITGEPEFVDRTWLAHHEQAVESGARLVHACGFDSVPHDLGALFTVGLLPDDVPVRISGFVRAHAQFSGGTFHSAVGALSRAGQSRQAARQRRAAEPRPTDRRVRALPARPRRAPYGSRWALPLPTLDPTVVRRSARALPAYGPDFSYGHFAEVGSLPATATTALGVGGVALMAQTAPTRSLLLQARGRGDGPDAQRRARSWFRVRFEAYAGAAEDADTRLVTEVSGGDPGYDETAVMLGQSALCLARDSLPATAGQVTTAQAMGAVLQRRLEQTGMVFRVVEGPAPGGQPAG